MDEEQKKWLHSRILDPREDTLERIVNSSWRDEEILKSYGQKKYIDELMDGLQVHKPWQEKYAQELTDEIMIGQAFGL